MRFLLFLFFSCWLMIASGQSRYYCEYRDTVSFPMPDSLVKSLQKQIEEKGLPAGIAEQLLEQVSAKDISSSYARKVVAGPDSTFILITNNEADEGDIKMNMPDKKLLFRKGKMYEFDSLSGNYSANPQPELPKIFRSTGDTKLIMNYLCIAFISADSSCRIWATADLPSYINPGIDAGNVKGGILVYEWKRKEVMVKSAIDKINKMK